MIGGGLAGLTTALELARRGVSVVLLEGKRLAWGASGRNGGFVSNGFSEGMNRIAARVGREGASALYQLSRFGTEYVRREIAEGGPPIKLGDGKLRCYRYSDPAGVKAAIAAMARDYGHELSFLDTAETRARVRSVDYFQSIHDPSAFHIHPLRYALMIAAKAEAAGARLHEMSPALAVSASGGGYRVRTPRGEACALSHRLFDVSRHLGKNAGECHAFRFRGAHAGFGFSPSSRCRAGARTRTRG